MKTLIIYESVHKGNTEKVARVMAGVLRADLVKPHEIDAGKIPKYDVVGFGSGIFFGRHHKSLYEFVDKLPEQKGRKAFVFLTSGVGRLSDDKSLKEKLLEKGFNVVGEFACKAWDSWGMLKLIGGINKGRPNKQDLKDAKIFAKSLKKKKK